MFKLVACNVFMREASLCLAESPHVIDAEFTEVGEHTSPERLRERLQSMIDATEESPKPYEAVLLLYGLCGNAGVGLSARGIPLVIPRAHDCCTVLLGSRLRFRDLFKDNPSRPFTSVGYMERGEYFIRVEDGESRIHYGDVYAEYVEKYGEENAGYIWEAMHPRAATRDGEPAVFIDIPETSRLGYVDRFRERAAAEGVPVEIVAGNLRLIRALLSGAWNEDEFLVVPPGHTTVGVYDWNEVIRATP